MPDPSRLYIIHEIRLPNGDRCIILGDTDILFCYTNVPDTLPQSLVILGLSNQYLLNHGSLISLRFAGNNIVRGSDLCNLRINSVSYPIYYKNSQQFILSARSQVLLSYDQTQNRFNIIAYDPTDHESVSNKVSSNGTLNAHSTDTQYPSAKLMYDIIGDVETLLENL